MFGRSLTAAGCLFFFLLLLVAAPRARAEARPPDVLYVPTPAHVVAEMLKVTRTGPGDVVYDLGCGDGRIPLAAVKDFGAKRGVGIDIDPERIRESQENARKAGVADRTRFYVQDLFRADFRQASVVTLYLLEELNRRLRPLLYQQLRPGTRIASHTFSMGEWKPEQVLGLPGDGREHLVYSWVIPAGVAGTWRGTLRNSPCTFTLRQRFQQIAGTLSLDGREIPVAGSVAGTDVTFGAQPEEPGEEAAALRFRGKIRGDRLSGRFTMPAGPLAGEHDWSARRDAADLAGTWRWADGALRIRRERGRWAATYRLGQDEWPMEQFYVYGGGFHFVLEVAGHSRSYSGVVSGRQVEGLIEEEGRGTRAWNAERVSWR